MTKIYAIHGGKLVEDDVKETAKMFIIDNPKLAFDCRLRIYKEDAFLTPLAAINDKMEKTLTQVDRHKKGLKEAYDSLNQMRVLATKIDY